MIREISIQNFKSVSDVTLPLGRVNVLIGENGCGKSNLLEGIALGAAASQGKLDNEFLAPRGIRVADPIAMVSAFLKEGSTAIKLHFVTDDDSFPFSVVPKEQGKWLLESGSFHSLDWLREKLDQENFKLSVRMIQETFSILRFDGLIGFLIYSPENTALRTFQREGQILPLSINGEGLFAHLRTLPENLILKISKHLELIDWFDGFEIPTDLGPGERRLNIRDRFLSEGGILDQRSANEGFLFLLFYYTLFISPHTPSFFAIDNIDASLNPKLCQRLIQDLTILAKEHDKQVIFTTHNPAILDGLDLNDDEQRLFVVSRTPDGPTRVRRIPAPKPLPGKKPVRLSHAFMRGYLGGLPKGF